MNSDSGGGKTRKRAGYRGPREDWHEHGSRFSDFTIDKPYARGVGRWTDSRIVSWNLWTVDDGDVLAMAAALQRTIRRLEQAVARMQRPDAPPLSPPRTRRISLGRMARSVRLRSEPGNALTKARRRAVSAADAAAALDPAERHAT